MSRANRGNQGEPGLVCTSRVKQYVDALVAEVSHHPERDVPPEQREPSEAINVIKTRQSVSRIQHEPALSHDPVVVERIVVGDEHDEVRVL